jgi:hypothetical protein
MKDNQVAPSERSVMVFYGEFWDEETVTYLGRIVIARHSPRYSESVGEPFQKDGAGWANCSAKSFYPLEMIMEVNTERRSKLTRYSIPSSNSFITSNCSRLTNALKVLRSLKSERHPFSSIAFSTQFEVCGQFYHYTSQNTSLQVKSSDS